MSERGSNGLWWLASYPKSGNTWTRAFLANLVSDSNEPVNINALDNGTIASSRAWVENAVGFEIAELNHDEVDALRPAAYRWLAANAKPDFYKIHDAYTYLPDGNPMIPKDATRGAVVIVRNPLDVVPSFANHWNVNVEKSVDCICGSDYAFGNGTRHQSAQLRQQLGTWTDHVESWLDAGVRKLVVRYEDLKADPVKHFTEITHFLELEKDADQIATAIENSRFEQLRKQEDEHGFVERTATAKNFFRQGKVGGWREELTEEQVQRVIDVNRSGMNQLGYLNEHGELRDALPELST